MGRKLSRLTVLAVEWTKVKCPGVICLSGEMPMVWYVPGSNVHGLKPTAFKFPGVKCSYFKSPGGGVYRSLRSGGDMSAGELPMWWSVPELIVLGWFVSGFKCQWVGVYWGWMSVGCNLQGLNVHRKKCTGVKRSWDEFYRG